jgi:suppressor of fused protein SUFU
MSDESKINLSVEQHVSGIWPDREVTARPSRDGTGSVRVLEVRPETADGGWAYVSAGAATAAPAVAGPSEFVILSPIASDEHIETLTKVAALNDGHGPGVAENTVVGLGRPWLPGSICDHLLAVPAYFLDEDQQRFTAGDVQVGLLWLVAVTPAEAEFARHAGGHGLFHELADADVDLLQIDRPSLK